MNPDVVDCDTNSIMRSNVPGTIVVFTVSPVLSFVCENLSEVLAI